MKCIFLGSGGSVNTQRRHNTSLFLQSDDTSLLIDCNGTCVQRLTEQGVAFENIENIFLTHQHIDHIAALPSLIHQLWVKACLYNPERRRTTPLNIYGNSSTLACVSGLLNSVGLFTHPYIFPINLIELEDGKEGHLNLGKASLTYFPVSHGKTPCFGFSLDHAGLTYSGDTEPCPRIYKELQPNDILIHDCNKLSEPLSPEHTSLTQIEQLIADIPDVTLYLVHLPPLSVEEEAIHRSTLQNKYGSKVILAEDGMVINL